MKKMLMALLIFSPALAFAQYQTVSADQLPAVIEGAVIGLNNSGISCDKAYDALTKLTMAAHIRNAESAQINTAGAQPVLVLNSPTVENFGATKVLVRIRITSTEDQRQIVKLTAEYLQHVRVNNGTLTNPQIADGWQLKRTEECK